ncbi:hypothetical protein HPB47_022543, partial [Ixodes persulcatus]
IGEAMQNSLPRGLSENSIVRLLKEKNTIMICTDIWDEAEALAKLISLIFPSEQLDVEAYHESPRDEACRGVIHGVRPELSNAQIRQKTKATGHKILGARRLERSTSALVTFAGTKVPFTVTFNRLETPCFLYKKTKAACLNCGEAGHRTAVYSKPTGYACAMCGAAQAVEGHPCVPKCALCGGAHKTYDSHCPEKFFKEKRQTERTGQSRSRHRNGEQQVRWLSKERSGSRPRARSRSRSASCKKNSSRPAPLAENKRKRKSRKRGKKQNRNQRSMSRDGRNLDLGNQENWPKLQKNANHINATKENPPPGSSGTRKHTQVLRQDTPSKGVEDVEMKSICSGTPGQVVQPATQLFRGKITQLSNKVVALERNRESMLKQLGTSGKKSTFLERKRSSLLQELGAKRRSSTDERHELHEAHLVAQLKRLTSTKNRAWLMDKLGMVVPGGTHAGTVPDHELSAEIRKKIVVSRIPRNMQPGKDDGRRKARTEALSKTWDKKEGTLYVDCGGPVNGVTTIAVANAQGRVLRLASVRVESAGQAEEVAIALAVICNPRATHVEISLAGWCAPSLIEYLVKTEVQGVHLLWSPGHTGNTGNEAANAAARGCILRDSSQSDGQVDADLSFNEALKTKKLNRRTVILATPAKLHQWYPDRYTTGACPFCGDPWADVHHVTWKCKKIPGLAPLVEPSTQEWEAGLQSDVIDVQKLLVTRALHAEASIGALE